MKIIAFLNGKERIEFELNEKYLIQHAVFPEIFENPEKGTKNYPESYMRANFGNRIVNIGNGKYQIWRVQNMDSFFATSVFIDLDGQDKEVSYIDLQRLKNLQYNLIENNLINWGELSRILSGDRSVVSKNRMPKKHEVAVSKLKKAILEWHSSLRP